METDKFAHYFLSATIVDLFDVIKIIDDASNYRMDIYLDEKKSLPSELKNSNSISYGFTEEVIIQDFPIRGKGVHLHLRRRKWLNKTTNQIITRKLDLTHNGTDLTKDFVAFLKATN